MTRGILDRRNYYYRRLYVDAVRGVETAAVHDRVDPDRIGVAGFSQGGAMSLAAAALSPEGIRLCQAHMPYMCDIPHAITIAAEPPYTELVDFLSLHQEHIPTVLDTLRYVDNAVLAPRILRLVNRERRPDGRMLPALDRIRGLQRDHRAQAPARVPLLRPRSARPPHRGRARGVRDGARLTRLARV